MNIEDMIKELNKKVPDELIENYLNLKNNDIDYVSLTYIDNEFVFLLNCPNSYDSYDIICIEFNKVKSFFEKENDNELNLS